jgi:hypothetical protein
VDFLNIEQTMELLGWRRAEVLAALRTGLLAGIQNPRRKGQWSIAHPGIRFIEYVRSQDVLPQAAVLSITDIAHITGRTTHTVQYYLSKHNIQPVPFPAREKKWGRYKALYSCWQVRRLIQFMFDKDPLVRPAISEEVMRKFFERSMVDKVLTDPYERVKEELKWIFRHPEPQRSYLLHELMAKIPDGRRASGAEDDGAVPSPSDGDLRPAPARDRNLSSTHTT